ncbi:MAG: sigma 54-interacting transcriptional regulator [Opitutaceae bacterium]|nr:sigma 54-interacting transcriptional regulator [Opitutaceae bacterium]
MHLTADYRPEFDSLAERLLELAQIRSSEELLQRVVFRQTERPHVALARIWLVRPGDRCTTCAMRGRCPDQARCLHLVASAGRSQVGADWSRTEGDPDERVPLGIGLAGRVAARGEALVVKDLARTPEATVPVAWAAAEGIHGVDAQPIHHKGPVIGVLALFTRIPTPARGPAWVRVFADHIAVALANAQAFEEIERLRARLESENNDLRRQVNDSRGLIDIVGQSAGLQRLRRQIEMVAPTDATVLIVGESGTGKELVAREIHRRSRRKAASLVRVNCASVPRDLYESEFFGHVRGAFTGAIKDRAGRFEAAEGGTLFLDEVGEIPLELQGKLLRVLQERQYERVGEERTRTVDVRIIAATNRDLRADVAAGRFRQDLYYRLNVFPITVLPLRERPDDIAILAAHFLQQAAQRLGLKLPALTEEQSTLLRSHAWPGNVRELQNVVERAAILAQDGHLRFELAEACTQTPATPLPAHAGHIFTEAEMRRLEEENILAALTRCAWHVHGAHGAAALLGLKTSTLVSRMKKLGLKRPR